jgi:hypothetical protein
VGLADLAHGANAETVRDHWWWRPGWALGRSFYTWHITFHDANELHELAARYRAVLSDLPGVTAVPDRWLHLTMQGVGFSDEITDDDLGAIIAKAGGRLATIEPFPIQLGPAVVGDEAIALPAQPESDLHRATPYIKAIGHVRDGSARTSVRAASLIRLNRDHQMYEWDTLATVPLGLT